MTIPLSSARAILARFTKRSLVLAAGVALAFQLPAQDLASLVKVYRETPSVARRTQLEQLAAAHRKDQTGALAQFALGVTSIEQKDYPRAIATLKTAAAGLPKLEDYVLYYLALARLEANSAAGVPEELVRFGALPAASPLAHRAVLLQAKAALDGNNAAESIRILRERYAGLPQPDADFMMATAYEAISDHTNAAGYFQRVYFRYPDTEQAAQAAAALSNLRGAMGPSYPPATPAQMLERGDRWLAAREFVRARQEFTSIVPQLAGLERDQARVRVGVAQYLDGEASAALRYFESLDLSRSEAEAERLHYVAECRRKLDDHDAMLVAVSRLGRDYPDSQWRLKSLVSAANSFLLRNRADVYEPLYKAVYEKFPSDAVAPYCHWKVAWSAYIQRRDDADDLLRDHVTRYPTDVKSSAAMYFLGRLSEARKDFRAARAYFTKIAELYPNYYYTMLARQRLAEAKLVAATPSEKVVEFLNGIAFGERRTPVEREPSAATRLRTERARLLAAAGFADWAESELRFGARNDGQPHLLAMELARTAPSVYQSLRYMKSLVPDYLTTPIDEMPTHFWKLLFPLPYEKDLVRNAKLQNLDPYVVAGLIRQESEFNPAAVSRKSALGLTQIMPATGRQLARRNGVRRFRSSMLFQPATNLKLGSHYLRAMLNEWNGKWEETLASYNAGKARVTEWVTWNSFQEPAEFVETIPFTETREYVQSVLRNAAIYRRLYGTSAAALPSTDGPERNSDPRPARRADKRKRPRAVS